MLVLFVFTETATTEFYTYLHTLSLHDALPICCCSAVLVPKTPRRPRSPAPASTKPGSSMRSNAPSNAIANCASPANARSEEHTSELQSIMRISYAVSCLKKKTIERTTHNTHLSSSTLQSAIVLKTINSK